jgi:uncharacterized membrane protein
MVWAATLLGVGIAGTLDEIVFHQLLRWHHFYDRSGAAVALITDGLFHIASTGAVVLGGLLLWQERRSAPLHIRRVWGSILAGVGGFNLYDGIIQHKVLRLHQVREGVANETPYDVVFIGAALVVLVAGLVLVRRRTDDWGSSERRRKG